MSIRKALASLPLLWLFLSSHAAGVDTGYLQGMGDVRYHQSHAKQVGRDFHIYVMLPDDYDESKATYPTIYLLDGGNLFPMLVPYYRYLNFGEEVPDAIIVGISYGNDDFESGNYRSTDYTAPSDEREYWGGAPEFQAYLSDELLPFIEASYRSERDRRVILGQSIGGQFVIYTALTQPNLFWGHIASNPAMHRNAEFFLQTHGTRAAGAGKSRLFVGDGTLNDSRFRDPALRWAEYWTGVDNKPWVLRFEDLEGHSHMSAPPAAFRQGMHWLFSKDQ